MPDSRLACRRQRGLLGRWSRGVDATWKSSAFDPSESGENFAGVLPSIRASVALVSLPIKSQPRGFFVDRSHLADGDGHAGLIPAPDHFL